jgi:hypothetical protein
VNDDGGEPDNVATASLAVAGGDFLRRNLGNGVRGAIEVTQPLTRRDLRHEIGLDYAIHYEKESDRERG